MINTHTLIRNNAPNSQYSTLLTPLKIKKRDLVIQLLPKRNINLIRNTLLFSLTLRFLTQND